MKVPGGFAAIRQTFAIPNYRLYVIGHLTSNTGLWVQRIAIGWLTWDLTESAGWLGLIAFADQAPTILLGLIAGAVVDRMDYFKLLRLTQALQLFHAFLLAACTLLGFMDIWLLLILTLSRGIIVAFNRPSRMTVIYTLVGRDLLASAIALNSTIFNTSRFTGPAIGGALIVAGGAGWTFAVGFLMFFVFTVTLRLMNIPAMPPKERSGRSLLRESWEGVQYILRHNGIRLQLAILVTTSVFARPLTDLLPGFAADIFQRGPDGLAWLLAFHGIGAMVGGSMLAARSQIQGLTRITIFNILIMAVSLLLFSITKEFWLACLLSGAAGYAFIVQGTSNQTLIQSAVDPDLRGRVISAYGLVARGGPALGALILGVAADHVGLRWPVAAGAALCLVAWVWAMRKRAFLAQALESEPAAKRAAAAQ
ncbi:MAG TPA: MFS transporter [Alphaproteobacteria bacterium]|nr:MFS transporter [Alphaproteobacteria bacterium]